MSANSEAVAAIVAALEELASWNGSSRTLVLKQLMKDGAEKEARPGAGPAGAAWLTHAALEQTASKQLSEGIKAGVASGVLRLEKQTLFLANKTFPKARARAGGRVALPQVGRSAPARRLLRCTPPLWPALPACLALPITLW